MTLEKQLQVLLSDTKTMCLEPGCRIYLGFNTTNLSHILDYIYNNLEDFETPEFVFLCQASNFESIIGPHLDNTNKLEFYHKGDLCVVEKDTSGTDPVYTYKTLKDGQTITLSSDYCLITWQGYTPRML